MKTFKRITTTFIALTLSQSVLAFGVIIGARATHDWRVPTIPTMGIYQDFSFGNFNLAAMAQVSAWSPVHPDASAIQDSLLDEWGGRSNWHKKEYHIPFTLDFSWKLTEKPNAQSMSVGVWASAVFETECYRYAWFVCGRDVYEFMPSGGISLWSYAANADKLGGPGVRLSFGTVNWDTLFSEISFVWKF